MDVISHPLRRDAHGRLATVPAGSPRHAAEVAAHALSCLTGERGLAPNYGLPDPTGAAGIDPALIEAVLGACEPDLQVNAVTVTQSGGQVTIRADVEWAPADVPDDELGEDIP